MSSEQDLFRQINNSVLDLQRAEYQTYQRPLKTLARLLRHDELTTVNDSLTKDVDLEAFLAASEETGGSMVGSHQLAWPDDPKKALGLQLLLIEKMGLNPDDAFHVSHRFYYSGSNIAAGIRAMTAQLIIPFVRDYKDYVMSGATTDARLIMPTSNKVFIVHGHDEAALQSLARFLEKLGLEAIILKEQADQGRTIIEKFETSAAEVGFAVVLLTPDDIGGAQATSASNPRGRQNVVFELGYFAGKLGRGRVCLFRKGDVEMPSDLFGVIYTDMDDGEGWKGKLVRELKAAKLEFDANRAW